MRSRSSLKNRHCVCFGYVAGSRMSKKFYPIEPLDDGCVLGKKATGKNAYWYVRMYWKDRGESEYRSTKILYEDSRASRLKAKRKANAIWQEFLAAVSVGDNPRKAKSIKSVGDYKKLIGHISNLNRIQNLEVLVWPGVIHFNDRNIQVQRP